MNRPYPPKELGQFESYPLNIMPALDMPLWVSETFINPTSKLYNNDHFHLEDALTGKLQFLWAATPYVKQTKQVIGQAEQLIFISGGWKKIRQEQQFYEWFGYELPDYVITLDGNYCRECTDIEFCALVEHELSHIGHSLDEFGQPKFSKTTGEPILCLKDHDVSEFIGIIRRYGVPVGSALEEMIKSANLKPEVSHINISQACGTCLLKRVA